MKIVNLSAKQFDTFASKHQYKSYYQTSNYANLIKQFGYHTQFLGIASDQDKLIGATLIIYKDIFMKNKIGYAPRGILFDYDDKEELKEMITLLKKTLNKGKFMLFRMDPYIPLSIRNNTGEILNINQSAQTIIKNLQANGFKYKGENLFFETEKPRWESLIILKKDIRDIFASFDKRTRNKIRRAANLGVEIIKDTSNDVTDLYDFIKAKDHKNLDFYKELVNCFGDMIDVYYARINTEAFIINSRRSYEKELERNEQLATTIQDTRLSEAERNAYLSKKMESDELVASYKDSMILATKLLREYPEGFNIAGSIVIKYDNAAFVFIDGIDERYKQLNANYLLRWKLVEDYNDAGLKYLNLNAIVGEFKNKNQYSGLNEMKLGFNSTVSEYIGEFDIIINNFTYNLYSNLNKNDKPKAKKSK